MLIAEILSYKTHLPGFFFSSTNTLRFPHSSWMNTVLSKSSKFAMSSISIPSSSSLAITFFSEGLPSVIFFENKTREIKKSISANLISSIVNSK